MSFDSLEVSQQDSAPVLCYQFVRGSDVWRYTALPAAFTALGSTWQPEAIESGAISSTGEVPKDAVNIKMPIGNAMVAALLAYTPDAVTTVTIFRTHYDDPTNGLAVWKGRILSVAASVAEVTLACEPVFTSLRRLGLRQVYQKKCRHALFSPGCGVNPNTYRHAVTVVGVSGVTVTLSADPGNYIGGNINAPDGSLRMIVGQTGSILTIMRPVQSLAQSMVDNPGGFTAHVYPGCDRTTAMCRDT